jgi:hypothetical protein
LFLRFAQDIAHLTERNRPISNNALTALSVGRFSGVHQWPVLGVHRGSASLYQILQVVSVTIFERVPILRALQPEDNQNKSGLFSNQLNLWDL